MAAEERPAMQDGAGAVAQGSEDRIPLGRSALRVSRLGVGAMTWGTNIYGGVGSREEEERTLEAVLAAGINFIDTAEMYGSGKGESRLGELVAGRDVVVATKFAPGLRTAARLPRSLDESRARLQREVIDLYQIHYPQPWLSIPKMMNHLADAVEAGKVRAVGVSNFSADQLRQAHELLAARGVPLASNQVQYSLAYRAPEVNGVLKACRELGITLIAYSPLAGGAITGKYTAKNQPDLLRRMMMPFSKKQLAALAPIMDALKEIGAGYGKTGSQVALRWLMQQAGVIPIPGAKNTKQAAENAGALTFQLTAAEVDRLAELSTPFLLNKAR